MYKFKIPGIVYGGALAVDDNDQVWIASFTGGVAVYNPSLDTSYYIASGVGFGNLPSNNVSCVVKDNNNEMWIGTDDGVAIVKNCNAPFAAPCEAELRDVTYTNPPGKLFAGYNVRTIAVDGANRKWVGTDAAGAWLVSPDGQTLIYHFTTDNSPLPSNFVRKIAIDKVTGDVYFGTENGLVSFKATATDAATDNNNITLFPNPVPAGYEGSIAVRGLMDNADVRITDISGQLVYRGHSVGGEIAWNGRDYNGHKPQSGVYLVFVSDNSGKHTNVGKLVFIQ
jgi:hypothetical protein